MTDLKEGGGSSLLRAHLLLMVALAVPVAAQGLLVGRWVVDDAGISFAYATNLAESGHLVSQQGATPVEGFSNPLWVALLAFAAPVLPLAFASKLLGGTCYFLACLRLSREGIQTGRLFSAPVVAALLLGCQPALGIWSFSGLENGLYLLAGVDLLARCRRAATGEALGTDAIWAGISAGTLALTRPEGIVFTPLFAVCLMAGGRSASQVRAMATSILIPVVACSCYLAFRYLYFADWLPNTYWAKGGPTVARIRGILLGDPVMIQKARGLVEAVFGRSWATFGGAATAAVLYYAATKAGERRRLVGAAMFALGAFSIYMLLPGDWMPEARFATLFFPAFLLLAVEAIEVVDKKRLVVWGTALFAFLAVNCVVRIQAFRLHRPISLQEVMERGDRLASWSRALGETRPSVLTADVGGLLVQDNVEVIDLGMLCDKTIGRSLGEGLPTTDYETFYRYIFEQRRPTFISTRAYHAWRARLEDDPRFRAQYVPLHEYRDGWARRVKGELVLAGDFVRRDLADKNHGVMNKIREEETTVPYPFDEGLEDEKPGFPEDPVRAPRDERF